MRAILVLANLILSPLFLTTAAAAPVNQTLSSDQAFVLTVEKAAAHTALQWRIAEGYYLYRDKIEVRAEGEKLEPRVSPGIVKEDETFGRVEVLFEQARAIVPVNRGVIEVTYQGCQDGGICFPPVTRSIPLSALADIAGTRPKSAEYIRADATLADAGIVIAADADASSALLRNQNLAWITLSFLGLGLLLAFTPCVFPIYPIVLGVLGRNFAQTSVAQNFRFATVYVLSLAFAFALAGAFVGWTGNNIQLALQSTWTTIAISLIFLLLAISTYGLFSLQLPAFLTSRVSSLKPRRNSVTSAAVLGFSSSLIVGPCVTAPLAGALLYIAQGGDWRLGALALFALGVGKGLPLIALASFGSKALPRAGSWMETVRRTLAYAFIVMAIWNASPLFPESVAYAAYLALALFALSDVLLRSYGMKTRAAALMLPVPAAFAFGVATARDIPSLHSNFVATNINSPRDALHFAVARTVPDVMDQFAASSGKPLLLYVTADWCVTCRTIERNVLQNPQVIRELQNIHLVKLDVSNFNSHAQALLKQLKVAGPPTMMFFNRNRNEVGATRLIGNATPEAVIASTRKLRQSR